MRSARVAALLIWAFSFRAAGETNPIEMAPAKLIVGTEVSVTVRATSQQLLCAFEIDFGDGTAQTVLVDPLNGLFPRTLTRSYEKPGNYRVSVRGLQHLVHPPCAVAGKRMLTVRSAMVDTAAARRIVRETLAGFAADRDIAKAKAGYQQALEHDVGYVPAQFGLGIVLELEENWASARDAFEVVLANSTGALAAAAQQRLARIDEVQKRASTSQNGVGRRYDDVITQAQLFLALGNAASASELVKSAMTLDATRWQAYALEAELHLAAGRDNDALRAYEAAIARASGLHKEQIRKAADELRARASSVQAASEAVALLKSEDPSEISRAAELLQAGYAANPKDARMGLQAAMAQAMARNFSASEQLLKTVQANTEHAYALEIERVLREVTAQRIKQEQERDGLFWENLPFELAQRLAELLRQGADVRAVAMTPGGQWLITKGMQGFEASSGFPRNIVEHLSKQSSEGRGIGWVSVGRDGAAIVMTFDRDGREQLNWWAAPADLSQKINEFWGKEMVRYVGLTKQGGYVIIRSDYGFWGNNISQSAMDRLWGNFYLQEKERTRRPIRQVEFGPGGEYLFLEDNNSYWAEGIPRQMAEALARIRHHNRKIRFVTLGRGGAWLVVSEK